MRWMLDTNVCIRYLNGRAPNLKTHFDSHDSQDITVCSVVKAELFYGSARSTNPTLARQRQQFFLSRFVSLAFDDSAAEIYGRIRPELESLGTSIGANDLLIASIAMANGVTLVTHNTSEFNRVTGLLVEDWEA